MILFGYYSRSEEAARLLRAARHSGQDDPAFDAGAAARRLLSTADGLATRVLIGQLGATEAVGVLEQELGSILGRPPPREGGVDGPRDTPQRRTRPATL